LKEIFRARAGFKWMYLDPAEHIRLNNQEIVLKFNYDVDTLIAFDVDMKTKQIKFDFKTLELKRFEILDDNGTGIKKADGEEIKNGLL
jgi:hypothetical protein